MKECKIDLGKRIRVLNLISGANFADDELLLAMREVDGGHLIVCMTSPKFTEEVFYLLRNSKFDCNICSSCSVDHLKTRAAPYQCR